MMNAQTPTKSPFREMRSVSSPQLNKLLVPNHIA